jgi:nitrate reductase gamma subunit
MLTVMLISVALVIFFAGNAARVVKTLRMPAHLRWELYPIPKGPRERQRYGGSYFEESDWWTKPRASSHKSEAVFVLKEVFLLRGVWQNFRGLWLWSWLLHWGLYLYLLATLLAVVELLLPGGAHMLHAAVIYGYRLACPLGLTGAVGLLVMRSLHPRLRAFTARIGIFDLLLLGSIFATGMLLPTAGQAGLDSVVRDLARVPASPGAHPVAWYLHAGLVAFFLAYFPFTHMTHAYMKYFTWHQVRWDDSPVARDPRAAKALAVNLQRKASWAAPHITAGGTATWSEVVADSNGNGMGKRA